MMTDQQELAVAISASVGGPIELTIPPGQLYGEVTFTSGSRAPKTSRIISVPVTVVEGWRQRLEQITAEVNSYGLDFTATIHHPTQKED